MADSVAQALRGEAARSRAALPPREPAGGPRDRDSPGGRGGGRKADLLRACDERARAAGAEVAQARHRLRRVAAPGRGLQLGRPRRRGRPHARAAERPGGGAPRRPRRDRHRHARRPRRLGAARGRARSRWPRRPPAARSRCSTPSTPPPGRLPVVVGNGFGGVLLHEAVGHGLEADAVQKRASVYAGRLGEQLAEPFVTAYDDGRRPNEWGSDGIDDEGTPTRRTTIIEDGRLTSYLYDVLTRAQGRRRVDRQRPARVLPPPAGAAHDQHLLRARRGHAGGADRRRSSAASTRSRSAAARWSRPPATSCSASPRAT